MKTQKEYHYTYYSYEEWGRGYFGSRTCRCLPEEDVKYFGSFKDKTFRPTQKIILKSDYSTRAEADADEIILHNYFEVDINPHFANRSRQTSTKFRLPRERSVEIGKQYGILSYEKNKELGLGIFGLSAEQRVENGKKLKELGIGIHGFTLEQRIEYSKKGGQKTKELGIGVFGLTPEQRTENGKKGGSRGGKVQYENKIGIHGFTFEERSRRSKEIGLRHKENKTGYCGLSFEERSEYGKIGGKKAVETNKKNGTSFWDTDLQSTLGKRGAKKTNSQKWKCTETGFIANPGNLTQYQKARGIDTSKRERIE
jgi:hypothetical protein